uniref:F-box domain-containing protein n=1 Tax=Ganoderma boninense TaxID=34458 RepID=A0A5K1JWK0_9APHY|nr:Uncharacterized protein [Ganoderma boninense]
MKDPVELFEPPAVSLPVDFFVHVLEVCDIKTLLRCARTCKSLRAAVASELRTRRVALFRLFFLDRTRRFNGLLQFYQAIVSGSTALAFFAWPSSWQPGDLDIYVGDDKYDLFVLDLERQFPVILEFDMPHRPRGLYAGIKGVRRYLTSSGRRLDVIRSGSPNPASPLLFFWTSLVVNFITPHGAVCCYPNLTMSEGALVDNIIPSEKVVSAQAKYESRGFTFTVNGTWRPSPLSLFKGGQILVNGDILVVDFDTIWRSDHRYLPIHRVPTGWVLKAPSLATPSAF